MAKSCSFILLPIVALFSITSCNSHSIEIEIARQSSELNQCEYIFGEDLNTLKLENAILLQTGTIDTTDEQPPILVAIVLLNKKETILKLASHSEVGNETTETYEGEGYKLTLHYNKQITEHDETIFKGKLLIEFKNLKSEYKIEGTTCNL